MKKIGIIGGLGPEATIDYYKELINAFKTNDGDLNYPEIIIYSVNMSEFLALMKAKDYDMATAYLLEKIKGLELAGAEFAALSANTPHLLFDRLKAAAGIPLILDHASGILDLKVNQTIDLGTHTIFVGELLSAEKVSDNKPMTYDYYHNVVKGKTHQNAPTFQANTNQQFSA